MHVWPDGEIVGRRRRGGRPFQRPAVPRIAGRDCKRGAVADAYGELNGEEGDATQDEEGAEFGYDEIRLPAGDIVALEALRHAHEAENIKRHEGQIDADDPGPEGPPAPFFLETK